MWCLLSDDLVLYILCFVTDAALPTVTRLDTLCHGFASKRLSSLKTLTQQPFNVKTSDVFNLTRLRLYGKQIGDQEITALASALGNGALDKIKSMYLSGNPGNSTPVDNALRERKK